MPAQRSTYTRTFRVSNTVKMCECMAHYAIFIVIMLYLYNTLGFNDFEAGMISGVLSGALYLSVAHIHRSVCRQDRFP